MRTIKHFIAQGCVICLSLVSAAHGKRMYRVGMLQVPFFQEGSTDGPFKSAYLVAESAL